MTCGDSGDDEGLDGAHVADAVIAVGMDARFWLDRWQTGQIAFHQAEPHPLLVKHHRHIASSSPSSSSSSSSFAGRRVYVPLCGKTRDLAWLRDQGHEVTGSELAPAAVEQLFAEQQQRPVTTTRGAHQLHITPGLSILQGDALAIDVDVSGVFDAIYDRAALIALPPSMRAAYVDSLLRVLAPGGRILLIGLVYDQQKLDGPPFAVDDTIVRSLFEPRGCKVEQIDECRDAPGPRFVAAGVTDLREAVFVITR